MSRVSRTGPPKGPDGGGGGGGGDGGGGFEPGPEEEEPEGGFNRVSPNCESVICLLVSVHLNLID